jgi:hypothetical protein
LKISKTFNTFIHYNITVNKLDILFLL